ncbi:E3 ubiquitin-protein ligase NRDP1-like isoform X1 [Branchiostoma lanceolatum]|uniref:E3 ubiquitin-protein ligase NRDP1-like isoform X1 n=1 Tax=Branchiostoma lanceolatum TaxID=7740 RepID=UPI0034557BD9
MGYDVNRFEGNVDEELLCPICGGVLEEPVQAPQCEHAFCTACIQEWLSRQHTCPVDRQTITPSQLKPVPRILRNLLSRLYIKCDNANFGCSQVVKLDQLASHLDECEHNPKRPVSCEQGCGLVIPKDELKEHNCVRELRTVVSQQQVKLSEFQSELAEQKRTIQDQKREIQMLKEYMRAIRASNQPLTRAIEDQMESDEVGAVPPLVGRRCLSQEVLRWVRSLQTARVTRWGGMISTPDAVLQAVIKRSLLDSGCPAGIVDVLMENAHERNWPRGLSTLETRQMNRRCYENYVTKRIPGKQAVVVMACENQHMGPDMVLEPGLVMIFAHGIDVTDY